MRMIESDKLVPLFRLLLMGYPQNIADSMYEDIQAMVDAHTVDAVPVMRGEWKKDSDYPWLLSCSVCGYSIEHGTNYCPNCGAKMEGKPCG